MADKVSQIGIDLSDERALQSVVLFLVEGPSDEIALAAPLQVLLKEHHRFDWKNFATDVFTVKLYPGNAGFDVNRKIEETIAGVIDAHINSSKVTYGWENLAKVIHITDTDGAYIPSTQVSSNYKGDETVYLDNRILALDVDDIRARNLEKKSETNRMWRMRSICHDGFEVPYYLFYMSRNLEHALQGKQGTCSNKEKEALAQVFRQNAIKAPEVFKQLLEGLAIDIPRNYSGSWNYIMQGTRSLERHSNLVLALDIINDADVK